VESWRWVAGCERRSKTDPKRRRFGIESLDERFSLSSRAMRDIEDRNKPRADALRALTEEKGIQLHPLELDVLSQDSADSAAVFAA
jgi:hypothetical protein